MAECSYSRCVQERRNIRRELQKWTKNMVYIVGLERIAEELMGRRKWKLYQESMSRNQLQQLHIPHAINNNFIEKKSEVKQEKIEDEEEQERLKDWSPQSKCYFCVDGKLDSDHTTHGALSPRPSESDTSDSPSDSEAPPTLTPSPAAALQLLHNNNNNKHSNMTTLESVSSMASLAAVAALSGGGACPQGAQVPFGYPPGLFAPNWHLGLLRNFPAALAQQQERLVDPADKAATDQPLDLSSKAVTSNTTTSIENKMAPNMRLPSGIDTKHIFKAKPRMTAVAGRRTYTEEELQAALRDIQSGKLGTRRAAVIYGIPRSTLRNKVYKLAMERERESHLVPSAVPLEDEAMEDDKELSGAEEEKEVEKALQGPLLSMADILRFSSNMDAPEALKTMLLQKASKDGDLWAGLEHSAVGPYIQNLLLAGQQKPAQENAEMMPMLPEIMRKMIAEEQHLNNGDTEKGSQLQPSPSNSVKGVKVEPQDMDTEESSSNVILKIPSFKPTTSKNGGDSIFGSAVVSPPVTSESSGSPPIMPGNMISLREAIAKSISQKFQQSPEPHKMHSAVEMDFKRAGLTPPLTSMPVIKNHQEPPQTPQPNRNFQPVVNKQPQNPANNSSSTSGGKGTRPKRGKYRNYDRDSLVEAVRAVQRGEMSVHRAGSYYGVPHSTLEYKVKERHLMRPRKRDPKPNPVDEKIASMKSQEIRNNIPDKMKPVLKPPQKFPPTSPNGIKIPPMFDPAMAPLGYTPPPFPFWPHPSFSHLPLDYPRNPSTSQYSPNPEFYASQMMQRLQEDSGRVHPNAAGAAPTANNQPALAKSAREMAESLYDGTGANGSFLDGIIRSSLESGVPHSGDKNKEDTKNVTPENMSNKALLDQLCRNSRITPLPKANTSAEPNSSGDESYRKGTSPLNFATNKSSKDRDSPIALNLGKLEGTSPVRYKDNNHEIQTIELSNDSNESQNEGNGRKEDSDQAHSQKSASGSPPARIYVKPQYQEITKPENLKPEVLVRFRDSLMDEPQQQMAERNGIGSESAIGSASEDMAQD